MLRIFFGAVAALILSAGMAFAGVEGVWATQKDKNGNSGQVRIYKCGSSYCGKLIKTSTGTNVGLVLIKGMKTTDGKNFKGGQIYATDDAKWFKSKMKLQSNSRLKVSGCILGGAVCRGQTWKRLK